MTNQQLAVVENKAPLRAGGGVQSIVPQDAEQAFRMAQMIFKSGMAPRDMQSPEKIVTAIIAGMEIGLKPFQAVQSFAVVNGRPTIWGDAALGLVQASGYLEDIEEATEGDGDAMVATCRAKRSDRKSPIVRTYSVADAKKAGLWGKAGPWTQYPKRMLQLRARAFCIRDGFPDVLKGIGIQEEVADYSGPSTERAAEASAVTPAALLAQANEPVEPQVAEGGVTPDVDTGADPEPRLIEIPTTPNGKTKDWRGYANACRQDIEAAPSAAFIEAWRTTQGKNLDQLKISFPEGFEEVVAARDARLIELAA